jgi:hypothetical protein
VEHSQPDVSQIIDLVVAYFRERGEDVSVENMVLERDDGGRHSLAALIQSLALGSPSGWATAIADHFATLDASPGMPASWEEAAPAVRLRIHTSAAASATTDAVKWDVDEGLVAVLMVAGSEQPSVVTHSTLTTWAIKVEIAFDRALRNTTETADDVREETTTIDGAEVHVLRGGPFTSAHLLVLDRRWDEAPYGAAVAIPNEEVVLYHPILDRGAIASTRALIAESARLWEAGPGAIVPDVFWWRPTGLNRIDGSVAGGEVVFEPSGEFGAMLDELPAGEDEGGHGWFRRRH